MQAIIVNGSAEEIAALALAAQERQRKPFIPETAEDHALGTRQKWSHPPPQETKKVRKKGGERDG